MKKLLIIAVLFSTNILISGAKDKITIYKNGRIAFKCDVSEFDSITFRNLKSIETPFLQDSLYEKIYNTLALTGNEQPAGAGDLEDVSEGMTPFIRLMWTVNELPTDEIICNWQDPGIFELNFNQLLPDNPLTRGLYARLIFNVKLCNLFLAKTVLLSDSKSIRQHAEVKFLRALNYYYLMDTFGNVPLITAPDYDLPLQSSRATIFTWLVNELKNCADKLAAPRQGTYYRADQAAAWMLLARLYINASVYTGSADYTNAATYAKKVLDSSYKLNPKYDQLFMADNAGEFDQSSVNTSNQEIIFSIPCDGLNYKSWGNSLFLIASTHASDMPSDGNNQNWAGNRARSSLVKKFFPSDIPSGADLTDLRQAANDDRAKFYGLNRQLTIDDVSNFKQGFSITKFSNKRADGNPAKDQQFTDTDFPLFRVAEAYLTYAEALFMGNGDANLALMYINALRGRSHASALPYISKEIILDEWAREFYGEGRRRIDLIRFECYGQSSYNWDWKGGTQSGNAFGLHKNIYPIPEAEIMNNPNLKQNAGY